MPIRATRSVSFIGLTPASTKSSWMASKASRKRGTKCEEKLREAIHCLGLKFLVNDPSLPGCPDLVFPREKVIVFVDGDFWHGRNITQRIEKLAAGHNSDYWIRKIQSNVLRDRTVTKQLKSSGWKVIRIWESEVNSHIAKATSRIEKALSKSLPEIPSRRKLTTNIKRPGRTARKRIPIT